MNNFHSALQTGFETAKDTAHKFSPDEGELHNAKNQLRNHTGVCVFGDDNNDASLGDCIQTVSDQTEEQHFLSKLQTVLNYSEVVNKKKKKTDYKIHI